jgi:ubiquinone/menaquinone biosynthesis C-methylase UbiE
MFIDAFDRSSEILENYQKSVAPGGYFDSLVNDNSAPDFERHVSGVFSQVWLGMTDDIYFDETYEFTKERFLKNNIDPYKLFGDKVILDAGCGSGKFSIALAKFGAKKVVGIDIGRDGLEFAEKQQKKVSQGQNVEYLYGSTFDVPTGDKAFDLVWSNGVIHHTLNYEKCVHEFYRVLKTNGTLFLHVNGSFGLYELLLDKLRESCVGIPPELFQFFLFSQGNNSGRVYWIMDCLYAPYEWKSKAEVEKLMKDSGFSDLKQLVRGVSSDPIEMVSIGIPFSKVKYGDAQLKYLAVKA